MTDKIKDIYLQYRYLFDKEKEVFTMIVSEKEVIIESLPNE
jgi:hypothetical protein